MVGALACPPLALLPSLVLFCACFPLSSLRNESPLPYMYVLSPDVLAWTIQPEMKVGHVPLLVLPILVPQWRASTAEGKQEELRRVGQARGAEARRGGQARGKAVGK